MKTKPILITIAALVLAFFIHQKLKPKQNDYDYLKSLPQHIGALAEKKLAGEIKRFIAKDYLDDKKRTYQDISGIITLHALQGGQTSVYVLSPEVDIDLNQEPYKAILKFDAAMTRGPKAATALNIIPESASIYSFTVNLEKTDDGWLVKSANWERGPI